jgi:hypothetical protein
MHSPNQTQQAEQPPPSFFKKIILAPNQTNKQDSQPLSQVFSTYQTRPNKQDSSPLPHIL